MSCRKLGTEHLTDREIPILASPCPMYLGSLHYCSPKRVIYITTREGYAPFHRDDSKYFELDTFHPSTRSRSTRTACRWCCKRTVPRSMFISAGRN